MNCFHIDFGGLVRRWRRVATVAAVWLPVDGVLTHVGLQLFQRFVYSSIDLKKKIF